MSVPPTDHLFPALHVRPPTGFVNDPNGPHTRGGVTHLYYQHRPATDGDSYAIWGHATSADLVNWRHHRVAISPDPDGPDRNGAWSGNVVSDGDRVFAIYSGYLRRQALQSVVIAESTDGGFTFGAPRRLDVAPDDSATRFFRDPFVWRDVDGWNMLVGAGDVDDHAAALLYTSPDLLTWSAEGAYARLARATVTGVDGSTIDTGSMWECPQLILFGDRETLLVSAWSPLDGTLHTLALTGRRRKAHLEEEVLSRVDLGSAFYAASVLPTPDGAIIWGWAREERDAAWSVEADWSGALTFPRRAALRDDGTLALHPIDGMNDLRLHPVELDELGRADLTAVGPAFELELTPRGRRIDLQLRFSDAEALVLGLDPVAGTVTMDATSASSDARAHGSRVVFADPLEEGRPVRLFVDGSIVELFTASGRCATLRVYPTAPPPWRVCFDDPEVEARMWHLAAEHPGAGWPDGPVDQPAFSPADIHIPSEPHNA